MDDILWDDSNWENVVPRMTLSSDDVNPKRKKRNSSGSNNSKKKKLI